MALSFNSKPASFTMAWITSPTWRRSGLFGMVISSCTGSVTPACFSSALRGVEVARLRLEFLDMVGRGGRHRLRRHRPDALIDHLVDGLAVDRQLEGGADARVLGEGALSARGPLPRFSVMLW